MVNIKVRLRTHYSSDIRMSSQAHIKKMCVLEHMQSNYMLMGIKLYLSEALCVSVYVLTDNPSGTAWQGLEICFSSCGAQGPPLQPSDPSFISLHMGH